MDGNWNDSIDDLEAARMSKIASSLDEKVTYLYLRLNVPKKWLSKIYVGSLK